MHCTKLSILRKISLTSQYINTECKCLDTTSINRLTRLQLRQFCKNVPKEIQPTVQRIGAFTKLAYKFDLFKTKYQLIGLGHQLYDDIPDDLNYELFFKRFNMPDTFYSWFLITELHVWMLMVRYMAEGDKGKVVIRNIVEAMWQDVLIRSGKLGTIPSKIKKAQVMDLSSQFNAAIIDYDEGILSDDKILAGALWRIFFCLECNNPENLENLLIYVRKQISLLDKIPPEKIFQKSSIQWLDLQSIK